MMLGTAFPWLGQSLVVFDVVFLVVGLPSIVYVRLGFQDLVFDVLTSMLSFIARGRLHSLLISFRFVSISLSIIASLCSFHRISGGSPFHHVWHSRCAELVSWSFATDCDSGALGIYVPAFWWPFNYYSPSDPLSWSFALVL
ncbi:hypothetical protein F2Q69_00043265 [Brassica cretica]|uniref:Uncharacterized protein n=1 Tax=Brassica cretica TaxID=69181 RepID=A0A8S9NMU7_BRACR|nr:hypothetical protein F2Q69_00043265 [Brassica cretica]